MNNGNYKIPDLRWLPSYKSGGDRVRSVLAIVVNVLVAVLVFLAAFMPLTYAWSLRKWDNLTFNEILYHMNAGTTGAGEDMIKSLIVESVIPSIGIALAVVVFLIIMQKKRFLTKIIPGLVALASLIVCVCTVGAFWQEKGVTEYLQSQASYGGFIDENYVDPSAVSMKFPEQKRNLIYIFLESYENTFADESVGGYFSENIMPELTKLSLENENFSGGDEILNGGVVMTGATWTMGAMFAQTSGLPLQASIEKSTGDEKEFLPSLTTLGDILQENGYKQVLLLGSDAAFGGRDLYFSKHGNYDMKDYKYYTSNGTLPSDYYVWWGYEDKYLFENARNELKELAASGEPFNLTLLTVDTHFEDGYLCSECEDEFGDRYSNVFACSSRQVDEFVKWIQEQPFYENTTIVISGDHLTMDSDYCTDISEEYERKVYTTVINAPVETQTQEFRNFTTFDLFPTTLAALGVTIENERLGLGVNLFSSVPTLLEENGVEKFNNGLLEKSELMEELTGKSTGDMGEVQIEDYDPAARTQEIRVTKLVKATGFEQLVAYMWAREDKSDQVKYTAVQNPNGSYSFVIDYKDFDYAPGSYNIDIYEEANNISDVFVKSTGIIYNGAEEGVIAVPEGVTCSEFNFETGHFTAYYTPSGDEGSLASVNIAVWSSEDQSDLRWYQAESQPDGSYAVDIDAFEHATDGTPFNVHAYIIGFDGQMTYKGGIEYLIQ